MDNEFDQIINKTSISVSENKDRLLIRSRFYISNKSNLGVVFFLVIGLFLIIISILKGVDRNAIALGSGIGGVVSIFSILVLLKQFTDFVEVTNYEIKFMSSLKRKVFRLKPEMKIKIKQETEYIESRRNSGSYFRFIELYLLHNNSEYRLFNFQIEGEYSKQATKLGSELSHMIKKRIKDSNKV